MCSESLLTLLTSEAVGNQFIHASLTLYFSLFLSSISLPTPFAEKEFGQANDWELLFDGQLKKGTNNLEEVFDGTAQEVHIGVYARALRLMESSGKLPADLARELGVRRNQLYEWKEQLGKRGAKALTGKAP